MDSSSAKPRVQSDDIAWQQIELLRHRRSKAKKLFFIGALVIGMFSFFFAGWVAQYSFGFAFSLAFSGVVGGAHFAHQPLAGIDRRIREILEPTVLEPFGLFPAGASDGHKLLAPFTSLGLVPESIENLTAHRYESAGEPRVWIEEARLFGVGHDVGRDNSRKVLFFGQLVERLIDRYSGDAFVLLPRKYRIDSLRVAARDEFLGQPFDRKTHFDERLTKYFQVWGRKTIMEHDVVRPELVDAAIAAAALFPENQLGIALTPGNGENWTLRMIVDFGALYRSQRNLDAALDPEVIAEFRDKLGHLMEAQAILAAAIASFVQPNSNVATTGT